ncbi:hypothetical protein PTKIN_Ptkin02bG0245100 [Pterospermum kingtungense]
MGVVADGEAIIDAKFLALSQRDVGATAQMDKATVQVDKEQRATTIKSFFIILFASLFLVTFLGFLIARRNKRQTNNENIESEQQPGEEQQSLTGNDTAAEPDVTLLNRFEIEGNETNHDQTHHRGHWIYTIQAKYDCGTQIAVINFLMEIPSAIMDQMASDDKPGYVLTVMLLSLATLLICLVELVCKGVKKKVTWRFMKDPYEEDGESRTSDEDHGGQVALDQAIPEPSM